MPGFPAIPVPAAATGSTGGAREGARAGFSNRAATMPCPALPRAARTDILTRLKARGIAVLLCGMLAPPNYGRDYSARFNAIYPDLAKSFGVPLYPFFREGVAADARLNQADGLHPTADGVDVIVKNILPTVEAFLGAISGQRS